MVCSCCCSAVWPELNVLLYMIWPGYFCRLAHWQGVYNTGCDHWPLRYLIVRGVLGLTQECPGVYTQIWRVLANLVSTSLCLDWKRCWFNTILLCVYPVTCLWGSACRVLLHQCHLHLFGTRRVHFREFSCLRFLQWRRSLPLNNLKGSK